MIFIFNLLVLFINDWVRYLLIDSYMQEGVVSVSQKKLFDELMINEFINNSV